MPPEIDVEQLVDAMVRELRRNPGDWISFQQLARRIRGDVEDAHLLAAIAESRHDLFVIHADKKVKLRVEAVRGEFEQQTPAATTPLGMHLVASKAVREYARQLRSLQIPVIGVDRGRRVLERYVHGLQVDITDDDLKLPDDTPVELVSVGGQRNPGHIAGASRDEAILYGAFRSQVLPVDLPAVLEVSRAKMLFDIADRLANLGGAPPLTLELDSQVFGAALTTEDSRDLAGKLHLLPSPWTRLLWGPPGAGKTYCVAELCAILLQSGADERVLIAAPSNVAVDAAVVEILAALERHAGCGGFLAARKLVRFGYPRDERVLSHPELFGPADLEQLSQEVATAHSQIRRLREKCVPADQIAEATTRLRQLQEQMKQKVALHLSSARVVATTVASAFTGRSPVVEAGSWQTVVADEASMISGAMVLALASLATRRLLLVGDPRQLAPIFEWEQWAVPEEVKHWLAKDPYEVVGLSVGSGWSKRIRTDNARMARVLAQRRCHPRIWSLVAPLYPAVESAVQLQRLESLAAAPPLPGVPAVLLDVSSGRTPPEDLKEAQPAEDLARRYLSACRRTGRSWENPPTAWLAIDVAREIRAHGRAEKIAIVTPYRGQVRLIRHWLYEERKADGRLGGIEVGTVHSFQGGEADAVIFDAVDGPPRPGLGILLRDDVGMRLVNVAVTRARGKLVVIADKQWLSRASPSSSGLFWTILFGAAAKPETCAVRPIPFEGGKGDQPGVAAEGVPESPIEEMFVAELRKRTTGSARFVLQFRIFDENGKIVSRADIAFPSQRLAIFCDGARYHLQPHQWQRDIRQRRELTRLGWRFLTFTGSEITRDVAQCVEDVIAHLPRTST